MSIDMFCLIWHKYVMFDISIDAIYFALTGLDLDLYQAEQKDLKSLSKVEEELAKVRAGL